jgi:hypothetical protein
MRRQSGKKITFLIASIKYLEINLSKEVKDLYKTLKKETVRPETLKLLDEN